MRAAKTGAGYLLEFPRQARFGVSKNGTHITVAGALGNSAQALRHLLLDQVIPWSLSLQRELVLHAGAVRSPWGALVFVGDAGRGKSTLCASLAALGWPVLTDDGVLLKQRGARLAVVPGYPGLRLKQDSVRRILGHRVNYQGGPLLAGKRRICLGPALRGRGSQHISVARIYLLNAPRRVSRGKIGKVALVAPPPARVFVALLRQVFRLEFTSCDKALWEFKALQQAVRLPLFRTLDYPRDYGALAEVQNALRRDLRS